MNEVFLQRIAQLSLKRNISINNPGNISGTTVSTTSNIAAGCNNNAIVTTLKKLCDRLDITTEEFLPDISRKLNIIMPHKNNGFHSTPFH